MNKRKQALLASIATGPAFIVSHAQAALPTEATAAFTGIGTAITDVLAAVWPLIAAVMIGFITIKLTKRGGNKV